MVRAFAHGAMCYFSFQPVLHDWCNKGHGMCYPVCGMVHIKEPLLLIGKRSPCGGSRFPLSLSKWSFTICLTPYNRKYNVSSASLNKTFPSSKFNTEFFYFVIYYFCLSIGHLKMCTRYTGYFPLKKNTCVNY